MEFRLIESYHKVFENSAVADYAAIPAKRSALKNDVFAFGAALSSQTDTTVFVKVECALPVSVRAVASVYARHPCYPQVTDPDYLNDKKPGYYPDLLLPLGENGKLDIKSGVTASLWLEADIAADTPAGDHPVAVSLTDNDGKVIETRGFTLTVIDAVLPKQTLKFTEWFHCDCLASYYCIDPMSERHWEIIENFARTAVKNGINMLYTPLFTPALDTEIGGERPTFQLLGVTKNGKEYSFDFTLVDRWLAMCDRVGVEYYEICHLFTQWGAAHAPKIMATADGVYKKLFGWETDSLSEEYVGFLRAFLTAFKAYMKQRGRLDRCMFHMSDEPSPDALPHYRKLREALADLFADVTCGDAISHYEFYESGAISNPIVAIDAIDPFLGNHVPNLWGYYCCSQHTNVSNRFLAMPMNRTRVIGTQLFKYNIAGFLQWGYNFYYSCHSRHVIDPYTRNDGDFGNPGQIWVPAGDPFSVYPAPDGTAYETLRIKGFTEALHDLRALDLLASLIGHDKTVALIEDEGKMPFTFAAYCRDADFCARLRERVNRAIAEQIGK